MDPMKKRKLDDNGVLQLDSDTPTNLSVADARKIIEPLTHDQLLDIVITAAVRHLDVLDAVRSIADRDPAQRKLFIRGLGWDTTNEKLSSIFSPYGDLEEAVVIVDKHTGKSKGFGFVTFKHIDGALRALKDPSKKIDGRMTVAQLAAAGLPGGPTAKPQFVDVSARKIYVANVPTDMPADRLLAHFLSYGEIEEGPLGFDKATGKSRGYALFVYKTAEAARASLVDAIKNIDGHQLNCRFANDSKRGKPAGPVGVQGLAGVPGEPHGDGIGLQQSGIVPGSIPAAQYGVPSGAGVPAYAGGYTGGLQGPSPLSHPLNSSYTGQGLSSVGGPGTLASQAPASLGVNGGYGTGIGGPHSGLQLGGPGLVGYGGLGVGSGGLGGAHGGFGGAGAALGGGLGGPASGLGSTGAGLSGTGGGLGGAGGGLGGPSSGLGGSGRGSSLYGLQQISAGMSSVGYSESKHYSLSSGSGYQSQHHQTAGASPAARAPHGGVYPPYY